MNAIELVKQNNLQLRTQDELQKMFKKCINSEDDFFGFKAEVIIGFLSYECAKPYLKDGVSESEWEQIVSIEQAAGEFLGYMQFAFGKAEDQRGISAGRSIEKLGMYLWIMNRPDLTQIIEDDDLYNPYGAPALIAVCDKMGIEVPESLREFAKVKCD